MNEDQHLKLDRSRSNEGSNPAYIPRTKIFSLLRNLTIFGRKYLWALVIHRYKCKKRFDRN